jgi:hypothetical protein
MQITFDIPDADWIYLQQTAERGLACTVSGSVYYLSLESSPDYNVTVRLPFNSFKAVKPARSLPFSLPPSHSPSQLLPQHSPTPPSPFYKLTPTESQLLSWCESRIDHLIPLQNSDIVSALNLNLKALSRAKNSLIKKGLVYYEAYNEHSFVIIPKSCKDSETLHKTARSINSQDIF